MSKPKEIQQLEVGLSESGKQQLEEIKAAVGLYGDRDPGLPFFVALQSLLDRMERFGPKFADTVRQSAHEARTDAVKAGDLTMSQVVERGLAKATQEMTASHAAAIRELTGEAAAVIRSAQPPTKNWRLWASLALIAQVGLLAFAVSSGWWYRGHEDAQTAAWAQTFEGRQAAEFYSIIQNSVPDPAFLHSRSAVKDIRAVLSWAVSQAGVSDWRDWENEHKRKK
jgi:hypothetical protein